MGITMKEIIRQILLISSFISPLAHGMDNNGEHGLLNNSQQLGTLKYWPTLNVKLKNNHRKQIIYPDKGDEATFNFDVMPGFLFENPQSFFAHQELFLLVLPVRFPTKLQSDQQRAPDLISLIHKDRSINKIIEKFQIKYSEKSISYGKIIKEKPDLEDYLIPKTLHNTISIEALFGTTSCSNYANSKKCDFKEAPPVYLLFSLLNKLNENEYQIIASQGEYVEPLLEEQYYDGRLPSTQQFQLTLDNLYFRKDEFSSLFYILNDQKDTYTVTINPPVLTLGESAWLTVIGEHKSLPPEFDQLVLCHQNNKFLAKATFSNEFKREGYFHIPVDFPHFLPDVFLCNSLNGESLRVGSIFCNSGYQDNSKNIEPPIVFKQVQQLPTVLQSEFVTVPPLNFHPFNSFGFPIYTPFLENVLFSVNIEGGTDRIKQINYYDKSSQYCGRKSAALFSLNILCSPYLDHMTIGVLPMRIPRQELGPNDIASYTIRDLTPFLKEDRWLKSIFEKFSWKSSILEQPTHLNGFLCTQNIRIEVGLTESFRDAEEADPNYFLVCLIDTHRNLILKASAEYYKCIARSTQKNKAIANAPDQSKWSLRIDLVNKSLPFELFKDPLNYLFKDFDLYQSIDPKSMPTFAPQIIKPEGDWFTLRTQKPINKTLQAPFVFFIDPNGHAFPLEKPYTQKDYTITGRIKIPTKYKNSQLTLCMYHNKMDSKGDLSGSAYRHDLLYKIDDVWCMDPKDANYSLSTTQNSVSSSSYGQPFQTDNGNQGTLTTNNNQYFTYINQNNFNQQQPGYFFQHPQINNNNQQTPTINNYQFYPPMNPGLTYTNSVMPQIDFSQSLQYSSNSHPDHTQGPKEDLSIENTKKRKNRVTKEKETKKRKIDSSKERQDKIIIIQEDSEESSN